MTVNEAVAKRVRELMAKHNLTQYALEKKCAISHGTMCGILQNSNKTVTLSTVILLAHAFGITLHEFLDNKFAYDKLEIG